MSPGTQTQSSYFQIIDKTSNLEQANEESRQQLREYEETKKQIEEDADREILDIKNKYERKLREEKEANLRLKGETGIMKRKVWTELFVLIKMLHLIRLVFNA